MSGVAGALHLSCGKIPDLGRRLKAMNTLQSHRGPDGEDTWCHGQGHVGFAHRQLAVIDLEAGGQPAKDQGGNYLTFSGQVYNYIELRDELGLDAGASTTDVVLAAYRKWGTDCLDHFRGMFGFALWDEDAQTLFCARDRFGIVPLYYTVVGEVFYFASETKALLPFVEKIETDLDGFKDYLGFQFCLAGKTLFKGIRELLPGHQLRVAGGQVEISRYWQVYYHLDFEHTLQYFESRVREMLSDSVRLHLRSDVPVGAFVSGGVDSGSVASLSAQQYDGQFEGYNGRYPYGQAYDESRYAQDVADLHGFPLVIRDITCADFIANIQKVIYHLDYPVGGPGTFGEYMVSEMAARHRKVVVGGEGGDETFGGYARYLIAYFEQCIRAAIDGTMHSGNFVVTYESIIPNLTTLRQYKPLLKQFWSSGLFEDLDRRYFHLINRAPQLGDEIRWDALGDYSPFETFRGIFRASNVPKESYFDSMTHFDFKTLLPALLQVGDRTSMAHGLESRVPILDHPLVELAATMPSDVKFKDGTLKNILRKAMKPVLPESISARKDKMGFPIPLTDWIRGEARELVQDILSTRKAKTRDLIDNDVVLRRIDTETQFGRTLWGMFSLEIWQQQFHDKHHEYTGLIA